MGSIGLNSRESIRDRGGFSDCKQVKNCDKFSGFPSTLIKTPWAELLTQPVNPNSLARR